MKICALGFRGFPFIEGGVEKHCESLYPLMGTEYEIIVFRRKSYVKSEDTYEGIRFVDLPSTKIKGVEAIIHSFLSTIYAVGLRPDVVHIHNIGPAMFAPILKLFSIPVVLTYHSPNYEHKKWNTFARKLLLFSEKIALKCSDKIIFVNKFQMQKYSKEIQDKSIYLPNGIKEPVFSEQTDFLEKISVQPGKYILSVGRITPEKGFDTLIRGFYLAKEKDYKLVIAGGVEFESGYMQELKEICKDSRVIFTGAVYGDDLAQLYSNAALYILASNNEGFPLVLLEAMSYKLDVLVSDIPATHLVKLEQDDYFTRGDHEELGKKIGIKLGKQDPRQYELTEFDWKQVAMRVSKIYKEIKRER